MLDFSSKNTLHAPPRTTSVGDINSALSAFHKFAKYFYNKDTKRFIGAARDFVIAYADNALTDPVLALLLTHWVNSKFSKLRCRLVTKRLRSALRVRKQFSRNDEELIALKESYPSWKQTPPSSSHQRGSGADITNRATRRLDPHQSTKMKIPASVIASLPKGEVGRRLCLRYISKAG